MLRFGARFIPVNDTGFWEPLERGPLLSPQCLPKPGLQEKLESDSGIGWNEDQLSIFLFLQLTNNGHLL